MRQFKSVEVALELREDICAEHDCATTGCDYLERLDHALLAINKHAEIALHRHREIDPQVDADLRIMDGKIQDALLEVERLRAHITMAQHLNTVAMAEEGSPYVHPAAESAGRVVVSERPNMRVVLRA